MSRTKGTSAQPGPQRWRQQPGQDSNGYGEGHPGDYEADLNVPLDHGGGSQHFPQHAFRRLGGVRPAPQRSPVASPLERPLAAQSSTGAERLAQRLQHTGPRQAAQPAWPAQTDPSAYDLAHYAPEQPPFTRGGAGHDPRGVAHDPYAQQSYMDAAADGWTGGGWSGQAQAYAEPSMDGAPYDAHAHGEPHDEDYGYEEGEEEDAPAPRRGPRAYVVVTALVGAIVAGGGLAYAYKNLGGSSNDGTTPVVRAEREPAKTRPADPGGREIAHTDKKFINRLTEDRPNGGPRFGEASAALAATPDAGASSAADNDGGPRKVTTLVVNRDGSMAPPNPVVPLPQDNGASPIAGGVPGMVIDGLNTGPRRPPVRSAAPAESRASAERQAAPASTPAKPQIIARAEPQAAPEPPERAGERPAPKKPAQRAPAPEKAVAAVAPAAAGNGYVTVLSSQKTRMDALKAFADMQQKYTDVLQNRTPDVREVDLGERGVWHRLVVGPPASRQAASSVCTQLKAHGYSGCWVVAY